MEGARKERGNSQFGLKTGPINTLLQSLLTLIPPIKDPLLRIKALTTCQRLHKHLPRLDWSQRRHKVHAREEETLGFDDAALAEK